MKSKHFLTVMAVTCMLFYVPLTVSAAVPEDTKTVTVSATASVFTAPDKASVILKVISEGTDSSAVQKENSEKTERVRLALKEQGVEESDLRTSGFYLSPKYDYSSDDMRIIGYLATNQLELTGQDLDVIGTLIAAGNEAGADGVENLNFYCSNYDDLYLEALTKAVGAAEV
ncbi:MAG: SIMPL domain-containing protein, partial [Blautia sp.]|nr:SIMPL domain-containing protein [Blautia sp.]